ncbi:Putative molybdenum carrier [Nitrosospira multiformis]|uniref:Putative molybdenum carrier n=1 Tax=Nitrosospira multiformis TaxID=1231 RepID=A0A1H8EZG5_9PROT|nr:putative molybdenum carrier protein [Nitrosospira multiformis]SEN24554.1 Putative molybdenum carrier [Nitrosospira multiformis]
MIQKIVSGGQTGVDRTALDWALAYHIPHGGCCPVGQRVEDGVIPDCYVLQETPEQNYQQRTKRNVIVLTLVSGYLFHISISGIRQSINVGDAQ